MHFQCLVFTNVSVYLFILVKCNLSHFIEFIPKVAEFSLCFFLFFFYLHCSALLSFGIWSFSLWQILAPIFSFLLPNYQFSAANKQGLPVSRDTDALVAKYSDPLVYTGSIRARTGSEILSIIFLLAEEHHPYQRPLSSSARQRWYCNWSKSFSEAL